MPVPQQTPSLQLVWPKKSGLNTSSIRDNNRLIQLITGAKIMPILAILNQAAKFRYMFGGKQKVPMVVRTVVGAGFRAGSEHSQTLYSLYTHIPGLKVVAPYDAYDAKGLLLSSIQDDDPVIFMEHKRLYMTSCEVPDDLKPIPLGKGRIRKKWKRCHYNCHTKNESFCRRSSKRTRK